MKKKTKIKELHDHRGHSGFRIPDSALPTPYQARIGVDGRQVGGLGAEVAGGAQQRCQVGRRRNRQILFRFCSQKKIKRKKQTKKNH